MDKHRANNPILSEAEVRRLFKFLLEVPGTVEDGHLPEDQVTAYCEGNLPAASIERIDRHLASCEKCALRMERRLTSPQAASILRQAARQHRHSWPLVTEFAGNQQAQHGISWVADSTALARSNLLPFFNDELSPRFGWTARHMILERLRAVGHLEAEVADEVLLRGCDLMVEYLQNGGGIPDYPERMFDGFCSHALEVLLDEWCGHQVVALMRLLEGEVALEESNMRAEPRILEAIRQAIDQLPAPFARFLHLDFMEDLTQEGIRRELGLANHEEYLHLKRLSLAALRQAIERLMR